MKGDGTSQRMGLMENSVKKKEKKNRKYRETNNNFVQKACNVKKKESVIESCCIVMLAGLIKCSATLSRATEAGNFVLFDREFVIVRNFLADSDGLFGVDDNFFLSFDSDDTSVTIGL